MHKHNITDETCAIYEAKGYNQGLTCKDDLICRDCARVDYFNI